MKQKLIKVLVALLIITLSIAACLYHGIYISPESLSVEYKTVTSSKIPDDLDNISIGFISDVYYGEFMNEERLSSMFEKIQKAKVDIILFGGDLFSDVRNEEIDGDTINTLTKMFTDLEAPLGKFYVLGDKDCADADTKTLVSNILYNAGFENMMNKNLKIHNGTMESITLIGLENMINGTIDVESAFASTSEKSFNLLFTHTPDTITTLSSDILDLVVAGHSLGGSNRIPFLGSFNKMEGAQTFGYGTYNINAMTLTISNGLGTTSADMRLFCPPQFPVFVLRSN